MDSAHNRIFILALTLEGMALGGRLQRLLQSTDKVTLWVPKTLLTVGNCSKNTLKQALSFEACEAGEKSSTIDVQVPCFIRNDKKEPTHTMHPCDTTVTKGFDSLTAVIKQAFEEKIALVCIMATGIVVRSIAPFLKGKDKDPAIVVLDENGRFAISLLSGHIGGANELAIKMAGLINATPVITTASDLKGLPALDVLAQKAGLVIEDLKTVKRVQSDILRHKPVYILDETCYISESLRAYGLDNLHFLHTLPAVEHETGVYVGFRILPNLKHWLILRPKELVVGVGCNRGTRAEEILSAIENVFERFEISLKCIKTFASIDAKQDETGLIEAVNKLKVGIIWYSKEQLKEMETPNPSSTVERHMGVASVCEAAALLTAHNADQRHSHARLLIPKQKMGNVTVAVACPCSIS